MAILKPQRWELLPLAKAKVCKFIPLVLEMAQGNSQR